MIKNHLPSNCYSKNKIKSVDGAVIHFISARYTMPKNPFHTDEIIRILKEYGYSYKYLIDRQGKIIELVPDNFKQYHAGKSIMNGREGCNGFTNGIALFGGSLWPYEDDQMLSLSELLAQDMTEHKYTLDWVKGHDEVRRNWLEKYPNWNEDHPDKQVSRKTDPGAHFKWEVLNDMLHSVSEANRV